MLSILTPSLHEMYNQLTVSWWCYNLHMLYKILKLKYIMNIEFQNVYNLIQFQTIILSLTMCYPVNVFLLVLFSKNLVECKKSTVKRYVIVEILSCVFLHRLELTNWTNWIPEPRGCKAICSQNHGCLLKKFYTSKHPEEEMKEFLYLWQLLSTKCSKTRHGSKHSHICLPASKNIS